MFYVYIMASGRNGTIYTGSTDPSRDQAFLRERRIKEWRRIWKLQLIESRNPNWVDLYADLDRMIMEDEVRGLSEFLPGSQRSPG